MTQRIPISKIKQAFPSIAWEVDIVKNAEDIVRDPEYDNNEEIAIAAVKRDETAISFIKNPSKQVLGIATYQHPRSLIHVARISDKQLEQVLSWNPAIVAEYEGHKPMHILEQIIAYKPYAIGYITAEYQHFASSTAVKKDGMVLRFVELENRTNRICYDAVMQNPMAIAFVPPTILTDKFYISLLEKYPIYWKKVALTQKNIKEAVKVCPAIVERIALTESSAMALAKVNYRVAEYYHFNIVSLKKLIKKCPEVLSVIGIWYPEFKTELYYLAFAQTYKNFQYMVDPQIEMCNIAISKDEKMISYIAVPTSLMFQTAITKNHLIMIWCKPPIVSDASETDAEWAVSTFPKCISWVHQNEKLSLLAVNKDGLALQWIRKPNQTEKICDAAVKNNPSALQWAYCQTNEMCKYAVLHDATLLRWVIEQNEDICKLAIANDPSVVVWVHKSVFDDIIMFQKYDS